MQIQLERPTAKLLKKCAMFDGETYDSIAKRLIKTYNMVGKEK